MLGLLVRTAVGNTFAAEVLDLSNKSVVVRFPRNDMPILFISEQATLLFSSAQLPEPISVEANVRSRTETQLHRRYALQFTESIQSRTRVSGELQRLFNRRGTYRVALDAKESVEVVIQIPERGGLNSLFTARLKDISATGLRIEAPLDVDAVLAEHEQLEASFNLPASAAALKLVAWIRNRISEGDAVGYGLEFDAKHSENFHQQQNEIIDYVMRRQRGELRTRMG
jgi:hypothetical protein